MMADTPRDAVPTAARVPTLTEVIDAAGPSGWRAASPEAPVRAGGESPAAQAQPASAAAAPANPDDRLRDALAAMLARFDADADTRLRHALQPILAEATERLVAAARRELASSLRDLMAASTTTDHTVPPDRRGADPSSS